jgi:hypothetical protein
MEDRSKQLDATTELERQAIRLLWGKNQYEDAIALAKRLLRRKPRYPLYYLILSDCYLAIHKSDYVGEISVESDKSKTYWDKAWGFDGKFMRSDYWKQGIEVAAHYLLKTQDLEKSTEIENNNLRKLRNKQVTSDDLYDVLLGQASVSKDPAVRLNYFKMALTRAKAGFNQQLYAFDSEGKMIKATRQEFVKAKIKDPKRQIFLTLSNRDPITGKETQYTFNVLKFFPLPIPSESVIKAQQRRMRYYHNHQENCLKHQRLYDSKNRQRKRVRNKLDYSWRKLGLTKGYYPREPLE